MGKLLALLLIILLALASVAGYLFLTVKITAGERQIAEGHRRLERGQLTLDAGKARLEAGKKELSGGKRKYGITKYILPVLLTDKLLRGGKGFREAKERIAEGDTHVAKGEDSIKVGQRQLRAGELELRQGREQLRLAKFARIACAAAAAFFASLVIVLGLSWRHSVARIFTHTAG